METYGSVQSVASKLLGDESFARSVRILLCVEDTPAFRNWLRDAVREGFVRGNENVGGVARAMLIQRLAYLERLQDDDAIERVGAPRSPRFARSGEPWREDDDRRLLAAFDSGSSLDELSRDHQRPKSAIRARLVKYGRVAA